MPDLIHTIETFAIGKNRAHVLNYPLVPSLRTARERLPDACGSSDGISPIQVTPGSASHTFMMTIILLSASVPSVDGPRRRVPCDHHVTTLESILSHIRRVWAALAANGCFAGGLSTACLGVLVSCLRKVLTSLHGLGGSSPTFSRASICLSEVLSVALTSESAASDLLLEAETRHALSDLSSLVLDSPSISRHVSAHLLPTLCDAARSKERSPVFIEALQAGFSYNMPVSLILIACSAPDLGRS